jgi:hypothetical protein
MKRRIFEENLAGKHVSTEDFAIRSLPCAVCSVGEFAGDGRFVVEVDSARKKKSDDTDVIRRSPFTCFP